MFERIKYYLTTTLGVFGVILYYALSLALWLIIRIPIAYMDLSFWGTYLFSALTFIPGIGEILLFVLWCMTFTTAIGEPFSTITLLYYIGLGIFALAYVIPVVISLLSSLINLFRKQ